MNFSNSWLRVGALAAAMFATTFCAAATVSGMYEATVPLVDRSEKGQAVAVQEAMREVLVRVTGQRDAASQPALAPLMPVSMWIASAATSAERLRPMLQVTRTRRPCETS